MKAFYVPLLTSVLVFGCAAPFLKPEEIRSLKEPTVKRTSVIYYREKFAYSGDGGLSVADHLLMQVGENRRAFPEVLGALSGSSSKLTKFAARVMSTDGGTESLDKGDLFSVNLSGDVVTRNEMMALPLEGSVHQGDLIEEYMEHELAMPSLGIDFSLADIGLGRNIACSVDVPGNLKFEYVLENDSTKPEVVSHGHEREYIFRWASYVPDAQQPLFGPQDRAPGFLGFVVDTGNQADTAHPWRSFGNWYLKLAESQLAYDDSTKALARRITEGLTTDKEKMDALFNYCQKNIRYEQVYLRNGEFIPNYSSEVLRRNYGDCKDYSTALYALAQSIGIRPCLALCYRGRGEVFYPNVPVNQFNHMLVYFNFDGKNYWYDGTDTQGIPGLTSDDLINQEALVLEKGNSRIVDMGEDPGNRLVISGKLDAAGNDFKGNMSISFRDQYGVDLFYIQSQLNPAEMRDYIYKWVSGNLNGSAIVQTTDWQLKPREFTVKLTVDIPDCSVRVGNSVYTSLKTLFPRLFPADQNPDTVSSLFCFPFYDRVDIDLHLGDHAGSESDSLTASGGNPGVNYSYRINPGPVSISGRPVFLKDFEMIARFFKKTIVVDSEGSK